MVTFFNNIDSKNKYKLLHSFRSDTHHFNKNEDITNIVLERNSISLVINGSINLIRNSENGNDFILDIIDENNIISDIVYNINKDDYSLVTNEETDIIIMNYIDLINYRGKNKYYSTLIKNLLVIMNLKNKEINERIDILTRKGIRNKLLAFFEKRFINSNSRNIYLPFTFTEMADYLGIDRSAMTRELKILKEEGFIKITGKRITLLYK